MKKLLSVLMVAILFMSVTTPLLADAKGMSGGSRGSSSSSSGSKPSGGGSSINFSKSNSNSNKTSTSTSKPETKKAEVKTPEVKKPSFYKSSGTTVKKSQLDSSKYKSGHQTSPNGSSFTNTLLTAAGVYLILDSFDSDGEPIYIDSDTGKIIDEDELEQMEFNDIEDESESEDESSNALMVIFSIIMIVAIFGFAMFMIFRW